MVCRALNVAAATMLLPVCLLGAEHKDQWQRTFAAGTGTRLEVRNINGNIRVSVDSGNAIRATVTEEYSAPTPEELAELRRHVQVVTKQEGNLVRLAVEHPSDADQHRSHKGWRFIQHFDLQVPKGVELSLANVNGRELSVAGAAGKWSLKSVNGGITLTDAAGHGVMETVNGPVRASFVANPTQASSFKTLNGAIDISFQPDLSADLSLSTVHGSAWTDFDYQQEPSGSAVQRDGNRYRISDRKGRLRVGRGGPEHTFQTLNGSIKIRKYGK